MDTLSGGDPASTPIYDELAARYGDPLAKTEEHRDVESPVGGGTDADEPAAVERDVA